MHTEPETFGKIIKSARQRSEFTMEELAERVGITERYLYRIENEDKKPSYDVLYKLIRELSISPDLIFLPREIVQRIRGRKPYPYALQLR